MYMVEIWVGAMQTLYENSQYFGNLITLYGNNGTMANLFLYLKVFKIKY